MERFDFLVIGGGIAGLSYALEVAEYGEVAVLFKKDVLASSTARAQGGIAAVSEETDSYHDHIEDTLIAGAGLCKRDIVELVVTEGPGCIYRLIERGTAFDREGTAYHLHKEGGHSHRRIFHAADATGLAILQALLERAESHPSIHFLSHSFAIDLLTSHKNGIELDKPNQVLGAYVLNQAGQVVPYLADKVLVATGGAGKVYLYTSNPDVATGDGIAMCYRAGVPVANMEFFQFHPTCLFHPKAKNFLITEAMRGEGATLHRISGERFMTKYHERAELAPRDIVARAIDYEMKKHGEEYVLLDMTHKSPEFVQEHFPSIYERCLDYGYDVSREPIPVVPAAHYCCGGVVSDRYGRTTIQNLYVAGECAWTGLHGANRLASNSLVEGLVFAKRAAEDSIKRHSKTLPLLELPAWDPGSATNSDEEVVITQNWDEIRRLMWNYVGIVRSDRRLERAVRRNKVIEDEIQEYYWNFLVTTDLLELRNLNLVAKLVIKSAMARKESRGLHYTIDYPELADEVIDTVMYPSATR
ncbi:MAG: L-aspartate oxidase [Bdellovibrionales bacterium]|nr:L-aspartate oxidase [Bdellovibrionales bacterium]